MSNDLGGPVLTRRRIMSLMGAAVLAGTLGACTPATERTGRRRTPTPPVPQHGDAALVIAAIADEEVLLAYCTALIDRHRDLTAVVRPVRQRQRQHVDVLRSTLRRFDPPTARRRVVVPSRSRSAEAKLTRLVDAAKRRRFDDCLAAESGPLARMLATTAAAHAVTADLLQAQR